MKKWIYLFAIGAFCLAACSKPKAGNELMNSQVSDGKVEIEEEKETEKKPVIIPVEEFDAASIKEDELAVYEADGTVQIIKAVPTEYQHPEFTINLPEGFSFYEKDKDVEKLVKSLEYEQEYGFSINYNDHDRHFLVLEDVSEGKAAGEVAYISSSNSSIAVQDITGILDNSSLSDIKKYIPGYRNVHEQHGKWNEIYLNEIMMYVGEGQLEVVSKGHEIYPFIHKLSFLAKAVNQKNHDTFYIGFLEEKGKVYNISVRSDLLDTSIDDLGETWSVLDTIEPFGSDIAAPEDISSIIEKIRNEYNEINGSIGTFRKIESNNGDIIYYDDLSRKLHRKVIEKVNEETSEYYYETNGDLCFVYFVGHDGGENRFYFHSGQLIRWIKPDSTTIDRPDSFTNQKYHEWESNLLMFSEQLRQR